MRQCIFAGLIMISAVLQVGCFLPMYSSSRDIRARELIFISEGLRHIPNIWERMWALELPDLMTPYRTHGGVI